MADIISLHGDEHLQIQRILPWYATGRLDPAEAGAVDEHLRSCAACRAELDMERDLARCVALRGFDADLGWRSLKQRIAPRAAAHDGSGPRTLSGIAARIRHWLAWPMKLGWFLGAQAAVALLVVIVALPGSPRAEYHTLGSRAAAPGGNVIVMFRPDTTEADLRELLAGNRARIVDGPNAAGAYVLQVPAPERDEFLNRLRARSAILLAQSIDAGSGS